MADDNLRPFLRIQTDAWLILLRDKLAADILANVKFVSLSLGGKSVGQQEAVPTLTLASQLGEVLAERDIMPVGISAPVRMTVARFA